MAKTFMMYHGNKTRLLKQILPLVPKKYNVYFEPMLGSGALFLALAPEKAVVNDINKDVVNVWTHVQKMPKELISYIIKYTKKHSDDIDLKTARHLTNLLNKQAFDLTRAALYMYLKQLHTGGSLATTNNGYYFQSFNNHGFHMYLNIKTLDKFECVYELLKNVKIYNRDYKTILKKANKEDFVYLDPPYVSNTNNGVVYNKKGECHILQELKTQVDLLTAKGVYVMISSSDFPIVRQTFEDYKIHTVKVYRPFKKKYDTELVITNY